MQKAELTHNRFKYTYEQVKQALENNGFSCQNDWWTLEDATANEVTFSRKQKDGTFVNAEVRVHRNNGKATIGFMCPKRWAKVYLKEFDERNKI